MSPTRHKPNSCAGCLCESHGSDFSRIDGTGANGVLLVGEASGEHEQRDQLPFRPFAPAGSLLERTFRRMGMDRSEFSIANVLRCRPRNNWLEGAPWEHSAIAHCRPNINAAIAERRPRCIVALGGIALRELTGMAGEARGIGHLAGYVLPLQTGRTITWVDDEIPQGKVAYLVDYTVPVIGDFHPAYLRRGRASHQGLFARILNRAVNIASGKDREWMWGVDPKDRSTHGTLNYRTNPSLDDARAFYNYCAGNGGTAISYDIETSESASLDEDAREGFADTHIRLVQFSVAGAGSIALPWTSEFSRLVRDMLHLPNTKCGHNVWLFDNKVLRAAGEREGIDLNPKGVIHDTLQMFHHWQPDLPAHLQFCASFVSFPFPWKHLAASDIEFYGCCDVDATLRLYTFLEAALKHDGIWDDESYIRVNGAAAAAPAAAA